MVYTIDLPLPYRALSPNARVHFMVKANAVKKYRRMAGLLALAAAPSRPRLKEATAQATFRFARPNRRDKDNLLASLKAAFDGLVDGQLLADDAGLTHLPIQIQQGHPGVTITIESFQK